MAHWFAGFLRVGAVDSRGGVCRLKRPRRECWRRLGKSAVSIVYIAYQKTEGEQSALGRLPKEAGKFSWLQVAIIAVIPIVSTSPVAVVASEMEGWSHLSHENDSCDQDKE